MNTTIRYVLLTAFRDRLFLGLLIGLIAAAAISTSLGQLALLEPEQMSLSFAAASSRFILVVGIVVFTCFHLRQAFDNKEIDVLLSRPISRVSLVLSYWLGFAVVASLLSVIAVVTLLAVGIIHEQGFIAWAISMMLELWLVVALALFMGCTLKSAVSAVLSSLGFYLLSRMIGFFIATAQNSMLFGEKDLNNTFRYITDGLALFVPRLDFFAKSEWLIYGISQTQDWVLFVVQPAIFIPVLLFATMIDFKRKQF
ncbi:MAG: hypothetical protein MRY32_02970 [Rickettsiales bacterium]|nr:hypothetical protein [Rickettsiales bacterium]